MLRGLTTVNFFADDLAGAPGLVHRAARHRAVLRPRGRRARRRTSSSASATTSTSSASSTAASRRPARPATPAARSSYWHVDDVDAALRAAARRWARPCTRSRSSAARDSSPRRSSTRSATSSASCTTRTTSTCSRESGVSDPTIVTASSVAEWRAWLAEHGRSETEAWLVIPHRQRSGRHLCRSRRAALCFGWIDGPQRRHDEHSARLRQPAPAEEQVERAQPRARRTDDPGGSDDR